VSFVETKEQLALQEAARDVVTRVVDPVARAVPAGQKLSPDDLRRIYKALRPLGYLGSTISRDFGGAGLSYVDYGLLLEALASGPVVLGEIVPPRTINYLGSEEQKRRWLPKLFSGDWVSTAAITEPQAGSDMRAFTTTATLEGDAYVVNGKKRWIKLGGVSDLMTLMVVDAKGGLSRLVLERAVSPWASTEFEAVGIRNLSFAELSFVRVRVPKENLLGEEGGGFAIAQARLGPGRVHHCMRAIGLAERALDLMCMRAQTRVAFGKPLADQGVVRERIAESRMQIEQVRLLTLKTAWMMDTVGKKAAQTEIAAIKVMAARVATDVIDRAIQLFGGAGVTDDWPLASMYAHARTLHLVDGPDEVHMRQIARRELGKYAHLRPAGF
jgi:acyl-CoA dehydrogenase